MADNYKDEIARRTDSGVVTLNAGYEHYKGGLYFAIDVAKNVITGEALVIYRKKDTGSVCARPISTEDGRGWFDLVEWPDGVRKGRFMKTTWYHFLHGGRKAK